MREPLLRDLAHGDFTVHRKGRAPADGIALTVDADGLPRAAHGPSGALTLCVLPETASVADVAALVRGDGGLGLQAVRGRLLVVLVDEARTTVRGVVAPGVLTAALAGGARGDSELYGPAEGKVGRTSIRCPHCLQTGHYDDVEPGETRCIHCDDILRPA